MIELPAGVYPNGAVPALVDMGFSQRGPATMVRIDRPGSHYRAAITLPASNADTARLIVARLIRAKNEGLRLEYPLQGVSQGAPGAPIVNGAGQTGNVINLRNVTPGYVAKEGFWLTIYDGTGQGYLHNIAGQSVANGSGLIALTITPNLRFPFADGAIVELAHPTIEGLVEGEEMAWRLELAELVNGIGFTIEEAG